MLLSALILPIYPWREARDIWREAEDLGFHAAYTYDHLSWRTFADGPWFGAVPTLAGAAAQTSGIRLGTMVTSPNFRHPVTLAKDLMSLDDMSDGRLTVGVGAGGSGFDATVLGRRAWSPKERADRFAEFVPLLDRLLREDRVTQDGVHYSALDARMVPGATQGQGIPLAVAAAGPRGMGIAARYGRGWVTAGQPGMADQLSPDECLAAVRRQLAMLDGACEAIGRNPTEIEKILITGLTQEQPLASPAAFAAFADGYEELGITEIVLHRPVPGTVFDVDPDVFRAVAKAWRR